MQATTDPLPLDWDEWRTLWAEWRTAHPEIARVRSPFKGKNFLADEILGVYRVGARTVELSELTFPNLSERDESGRLIDGHARMIGLTFADGATALVRSFAGLEEALGI